MVVSRSLFVLALSLLALPAVEPAMQVADESSWSDALIPNSAGLFLGIRHLGQGPWEEIGSPLQVGLTVGWPGLVWGIEPILGIAEAQGAGVSRNRGTGTFTVPIIGSYEASTAAGQVDITIWEYQAGLRRRWQWSAVEFAVAGGPVLVQTTVRRTPAASIFPRQDPDPADTGRGTAFGGWSTLGIAWVHGGTRFGVEGRYTVARTVMFEDPADFGGWQAGALFGMGW